MNKLLLTQMLYTASDMYDRLKRFDDALHDESKHKTIYPEYAFQQEPEFINEGVDIFLAGDKSRLFDYCEKNKDIPNALGDLCSDILRDPEMQDFTNLFACMAKILSLSDKPHLSMAITLLTNKMLMEKKNFNETLHLVDKFVY